MTMAERFTVRITRDDGSVTYRCSTTSRAYADAEAAAWHDCGRAAEVTTEQDARADLAAWRKATKDAQRTGARYFPAVVAS